MSGVRSECFACGEVFAGLGAFARHRVSLSIRARRCLTVHEMLRKGFVRGRYGHWTTTPQSPTTPRDRVQEAREPLSGR